MIHDYYLKCLLEPTDEDNIKPFDKWKKNSEQRLKEKSNDEKCLIWQQEEIVGRKKKDMIFSKNKDIHDFYPKPEELKTLPENSALIKIFFTLEKPYTSKDEGEFHIIDGKIFENPIVRDKFTGLPMVRPSTWKGHLRFAAEEVDGYDDKKNEIKRRLFGSEPDKKNALKGRLYFFPTFFTDEAGRDVITPLKRDTRTPARGPISLEVMKPNSQGEFHLLYFPYPRDENFKENEIKEDLEFLAKALKLMFYTYGFSAKKTSGFGIIKDLEDKNVEIYPKDKKSIFSILYTKVNKIVNHGAYK